jgi:hypothetical protein
MRSHRRLALALTLGLALATRADAQSSCPQEPRIDNHVGAGTTACPCFVAGEQWGAVFNPPAAHYPIEVLRVGFGWGSVLGGSPQSLEANIHVYAGGLPNPGAPIATLPGPVLSDGFINEFDLDPLPGKIVVNSGPVTATIELLNDSTFFGGAPVHDGSGCISGRNVVFAIPGGWSNACSLGVSGNWLVHLVYRRVNCTGGPGTPFCFGVGCPCGNDSPASGCVNSTGSGAVLTATGSTSVSLDNLVLTTTGFPPNNSGLYFMGGAMFAPVFVGDGLACTGGIWRFFPGSVSPGGTFTQVNPVFNSFPGAINPGDTRNFQSWARDVLCGPPPAPCPSPCGLNSNLSNGYSVVFTP